MPPAVYMYVRDHLLGILRKFYAQVECPIEEPGKTDYGDVDILVAGPLQDLDSKQLAAIFGAVKHKRQAGNPTTNFAVPWPKLPHLLCEQSVANKLSEASLKGHDQMYIQLDLHLCDPQSFTWEVFHQAHGDFWNIIGATVRRLGLTISNSGFYVRVEEIEARNKNAARVLLTDSPTATLKFLGLDEARYWQKFETADQLLAYAATCRFFNPKRYDLTGNKGDLNGNDRVRVRKRAVVRMWIEEYIPAHVSDDPADAAAACMSREEVAEEAKKYFGIAEEYEERRMKGLRETGRERLLKQIRKELDIEGDSVGAVMRGVKREVINEQGQREADLTTLQRAYAEDEFETIVQWVRDSWKEIEERQRAYEKEESTKHLLAKLKKLRAEGKADVNTRLGRAKVKTTEDDDGGEADKLPNESL